MNLFVDLDGVIADFDKKAREILGKQSFTKRELWQTLTPIIKAGEFWPNLELMEDAIFLWKEVSTLNPTILTATGHISPGLTSIQKKKWVRDNLCPDTPVITVRTAKDKILYAKNNLLIDDRKDTIENWNASGGIGILHISASMTIKELRKVFNG